MISGRFALNMAATNSGNEYRIIFFFHDKTQAFIVLHAVLKNTPRLDADDISTAEGRMSNWLKRNV